MRARIVSDPATHVPRAHAGGLLRMLQVPTKRILRSSKSRQMFSNSSNQNEGSLERFVLDKKQPEVYSDEEIQKILAGCKREYHQLVFETLLKSGMRKEELAFLEWRNVNFTEKMFHVRSKPELGFRIKDHEERDIPIEDGLLQKLKAWHKKSVRTRYAEGKSNRTSSAR